MSFWKNGSHPMDYRARQRRIVEALPSRKVDVLLVTHLPNIRYLCGFTGSNGVLALGERAIVFFTDGRYTEQARTEVVGARVVIPKQPVMAAAAKWLSQRSARSPVSVGVEAEHLTIAGRASLEKLLPSKVRLRATSGVVERERMVKDVEEMERIRAAVRLGDSLFDCAVKTIRPGITESEVAAELEYAARRAGAEEMSFPTIVAAGPRSALPHARASEHRIGERGFVVLDFGVILAGYCSDMTRTVHVGQPTTEARGMYEAVREAQNSAVQAVRSGAMVGEVDQAARGVLRRAGLATFFSHSTGHGVGLEIHEPPRVASGQQERLRQGMVITVEPGVYLAGNGGVRIEDMVVVTDGGCEVLTGTTKELIAI